MSDGPGRAEFTAFTERLYETMDDGFKGTHARLDAINGRIFKGEVDRENLRQRLVTIERELFRHPRRRSQDQGFTRREKALMALGLGVITALIKLITFMGEKAWHMLTTAKP